LKCLPGPPEVENYSENILQNFSKKKVLAANQGLYNGFLAAGLIWTFFIKDPIWQTNVALFFLICVSVAGIYGALTANKKIFFMQALPALITILLILIS
jgi:putative membrane protein